MKTLVTLVLTSLSLISLAGIITVDNRTGSSANYSSLQSAINNASSGDTVYIHPSAVSYGNQINLNKSLVLIGPGHHPEYTGGTGAYLGDINLQNNSSGSKITGLILKRISVQLFNTSHNIVIRNNFFEGHNIISGAFGDGSKSNDWLIEGNVAIEETGCGGCTFIDVRTGAGGSPPNANWIIRNNFIQTKGSQNNTTLFGNLNSTTIVENNIILYRHTNPVFNTNVIGGELRNNIIWVTNGNVTDITENANNVLFQNNLTYHSNGTLDPLPGNDNIDNADPEFLYLESGNPVWNMGNDYHLSETSPGHNTGTDDTDLGIYGTNFPFRMNGYPQDIPRLKFFQVSNTVVPQGGTMEIHVKAVRAGL